ncbi:MAG: tRNA (guanosine(37)-N1)-methyltransferase TrmD [Pseudomonadota bacterium]
MKIDVITLFPEFVSQIKEYGVVGRAIRQGKVDLCLTNPRDFTDDPGGRVDDRPYGGGPGMVIQFSPLEKSLEHVLPKAADKSNTKIVYLSPQGKCLDQKSVRNFAEEQHLVLICGRYEGVDERFIESYVDEEWSIGDYVISGGELGAMVLIDAMIRTLPDVLGDEASAQQDSFENGMLDYPHYTRPEAVNGRDVPEVLISGDHKLIARWRLKQVLGRTHLRRPDLLEKHVLSEQEQGLLNEYLEETQQIKKR